MGNHRFGKGVEQDYTEAVRWFTPAAEQGDNDAIRNLINIYSEGGYGIKKNYKEVVKWYTILVEQGDYYAKQALANIYYEGGYGIEKDYKEAVKRYKPLAKQKSYYVKYDSGGVVSTEYSEGYSAQYKLGDIYSEGGYGIEKDKQEADKWYKLAFKNALSVAKKGGDDNPVEYAQNLVGLMYEFGKGVEKNYDEAFKWYSRSVKRIADSRYRLSIMYSKGYGAKEDTVRALMWGILSLDEDPFIYPRLLGILEIYALKEIKVFRDSLLNEMTPEQIEQAEQLAKACKESDYTKC